MNNINYVFGDVTEPVGDGMKVLAHLCNDAGGWGRGLVLAISRRWSKPERAYRSWARGRDKIRSEQPGRQGTQPFPPFQLGEVQFVQVEPELYVANVLGQHGYFKPGGPPAIRYDALRQGLARVREFAEEHGASVHLPRIGCRLAGGNWEQVGPIVHEELCGHGVSVTIYDLPPKPRDREVR